jgi:hypothetical protein
MSPTPTDDGDDILTSAKVAQICGVPIDRIYAWADAGILPCWRTAVDPRRCRRTAVVGPRRYSRRAIEAFAARRAATNQQRAAARAAKAAARLAAPRRSRRPGVSSDEVDEEAICIRALALWSRLTLWMVHTSRPGALVREVRRDYRRAWRNIRTIGRGPPAAEQW